MVSNPSYSEVSEGYNEDISGDIYNLGKDISNSVACLEPKIESDQGEVKINEILSKEDYLYLEINEKFQ